MTLKVENTFSPLHNVDDIVIDISLNPKARSELLDIHVMQKNVLDKIINFKVSHSCGLDGISN